MAFYLRIKFLFRIWRRVLLFLVTNFKRLKKMPAKYTKIDSICTQHEHQMTFP